MSRLRAILLSFVLIPLAEANAGQPTYTVFALQVEAPDVDIGAVSANNKGDMLVARVDANSNRTFNPWFVGEGYVDLQPPDGATITRLSGLNDQREVVGSSTSGGFYWSPADGWMQLPVPAGIVSLTPNAISQTGEVVGFATSSQGISVAFRWGASFGTQILDDTRPAAVNAVNTDGALASTHLLNITDAEIAYTGQVKILKPLFISDSLGSVGINDSGATVLNETNVDGRAMACIWAPNHPLRSLSSNSKAAGIDNSGNVVGVDFGLPGEEAFAWVWGPSYGRIELDKTLASGSPKFSSFQPNFVTNQGVIAGEGVINGIPSAVLLIPED